MISNINNPLGGLMPDGNKRKLLELLEKAVKTTTGPAVIFVDRLDALFTADSATTGRTQADITGLIGQYAHGNEPSHHVAWLYHYAGRPDQSARRIDRIRRDMYTAEPDGLIGNEDCGQMSSWYVFGAMGLYPVCPGSDEYVIGTPLFDRVSIDVGVSVSITLLIIAGEDRQCRWDEKCQHQ